MSNLSISSSNALSNRGSLQVDNQPDIQKQDTQEPYVSKSDTQARAAKSELLTAIKNRPLNAREITVDNLISKDGLKLAFGKASRYANVKDRMMRAAYTMVHREKATDGTGSLHKSALRLADKYEKLVADKAPESERLTVLRELRGKVEGMHDKDVGRRVMAGQSHDEAVVGNLKDMLDFIDHTIASHPTEHLAKAKELMGTTYPELKQSGAGIQTKIDLLTAVKDHLLAAREGGVALDNESTALLETVERDLTQLTGHQPLKTELEEFVKNKDKNLKHVHTTEKDVVADMRARYQHNEHREHVKEDTLHDLRHWRVGLDIRSFDKSNLKHVDTHERTGLDAMRDELESGSLTDDLTGSILFDRTVERGPVIKDPDLTNLTSKSLNSESFNSLGSRIDKALKDKNNKALDSLAKELGTLLAEDLRGQTKDVQLGFATSRGAAFKNDLLHLLSSQLGSTTNSLSGNYPSSKPEISKLLDAAYTEAVTHLNDRYVDENSIVLDGVTFTKTRTLSDKGGFGSVSVFEGEIGGKKVSLAVKIPKMDPSELSPTELEEGFKMSADEARSHRAATEGGSPFVVGFRGAVPTPDGRLLLAMDLETGGDMADFGSKLLELQEKGTVSQHAANLVRITLLQDMTEGLRHLQEVRGMTHIDLKLLNYFISAEGVSKMGDFGLAGTSLTRDFNSRPVDSPMNLSPEIVQGSDRIAEQRTRINEAIKNLQKRYAEETPKLPHDEQRAVAERLNQTIEQLRAMSNELTFSVNHMSDTFSLGTAAFELFHGSDFVDELTSENWTSVKIGAIGKYGDEASPGAGLLGLDSSGEKTGFGATALDRLLNMMLHPDPTQRPAATDILSLSLFSEPGIGGEDVRHLITTLLDKNSTPEQIKAASDKLGI